MKNLTTALLAMMIVVLVGLGCSQSETKVADASDTNSKRNSDADAKTPISSRDGDIAGSYGITGKNPAGQKYNGDLTIKKQDEVYQFSWNVANSAYDGVGVREGNLIAVGYGAGHSGKGCGAAVYKIGDKTLDGKLGGWGFNNVGTQTAVLLKNSDKGEVYKVDGTDTDGTEYSAELFVALSKSDVYQFAFANNGKAKYVGTGIRVGDTFGAGMGIDKKCGYVVYEVKGDRLEAAWGIIGDDRLGTETATKN